MRLHGNRGKQSQKVVQCKSQSPWSVSVLEGVQDPGSCWAKPLSNSQKRIGIIPDGKAGGDSFPITVDEPEQD